MMPPVPDLARTQLTARFELALQMTVSEILSQLREGISEFTVGDLESFCRFGEFCYAELKRRKDERAS